MLQKKVGSKQAEKHFNAHIRTLVRSNRLPDYALTVEAGQAVFYKREGDDASGGRTASHNAVTTLGRLGGRYEFGWRHGRRKWGRRGSWRCEASAACHTD